MDQSANCSQYGFASSPVSIFGCKYFCCKNHFHETVSSLSRQAQCLDNGIETSERDDIKLVFDLATSCTNLLVKDLMSKTNFVGLIDADSCAPICELYRRWRDASRLAMQNQTNELDDWHSRNYRRVSSL